MLAFYSVPRAFEGEFDDLQRMAIESWLTCVDNPQVILMGSDSGVREACREYGLQHAPALPRNRYGTPLVNGAFFLAESLSRFDILCEVSADIIFSGEIAYALKDLEEVKRPFVVGQRHDVNAGDPKSAKLHPPSAADYFIYRKGTIGEIPAFAYGRTAYDNWLIWAAIHKWDMTVIDATPSIMAIHVNHGYPAWKKGKGEMLNGEEKEENHRLAFATGMKRWYGTNDAPFVLKAGRLEERILA